ncbi:hypothetical protein [Nocardioides marmoraquaticus]
MPEDSQGFSSSDAVTHQKPWIRVVAVVVVLALVGGAGFLAFTVLTDEPQRTISMPSTVAGMQRDTGSEQANAEGLQAGAAQLEELATVARSEGAVYTNTDASNGPAGTVTVIGAETREEIDPARLIDRLITQAEGNDLEASREPAGDDAEGACVSDPSGATPTQCFWATTRSFGQVAAFGDGWTVDQVAALTVRVRGDVETTD